jgi:hypothetical protein
MDLKNHLISQKVVVKANQDVNSGTDSGLGAVVGRSKLYFSRQT